jgi:hypothetical protein
MIDTTWLKSAYGSRDETEVNIPHVPEVAHVPGLPENPEQQVAVLAAENAALRQANSDLRNQAGRLEKELDRRAEERREENELQKQNNVLMQQIYTLLSRTGSGLLPSQRASENLPGQLATVDANTSADQEGTESASPNPRRTKTVQKQPTPKARPTRASNQPSSKSNSQTTLQRWFPTLLGAGRRQKK